jgi:hypothetical protein
MFLLAATALAGGCGGEPEKAKAPERPQAMQAGQWQSTSEVTNFRQADQGRPRLNMPIGTRGSAAACVEAADVTRPPEELFVGSDFEDCAWGENFYMRNGRLISSMTCQRDGVGNVEVTVSVDFTPNSYEGTVEFVTRLPTDGDVIVAARSRGTRAGECPVAGGGNESQPR